MGNADSHRRSVDLFNKRDWSAFTAAYAPACEYVDQARSFTAKGREQVQDFEQGWVNAFSNATITDAQVIDAGASTVLLFTGSGTNDGPFGPMPATGRQVSMRFCEVREYDADGLTVRAQLFYDQVTMLVQLGHMPAPEG